jgi:hypothetical protein
MAHIISGYALLRTTEPALKTKDASKRKREAPGNSSAPHDVVLSSPKQTERSNKAVVLVPETPQVRLSSFGVCPCAFMYYIRLNCRCV